jgi:hypothetical protein
MRRTGGHGLAAPGLREAWKRSAMDSQRPGKQMRSTPLPDRRSLGSSTARHRRRQQPIQIGRSFPPWEPFGAPFFWGLAILVTTVKHLGVPVPMGHDDASPRPKNTRDFRHERRNIREALDQIVGVRDIDASVIERKRSSQ